MNVVIDTGSSNFAVAASSAAGVTPTFNASEFVHNFSEQFNCE